MKNPFCVDHVDLKRFLKRWYVITGRTTFLEKEAFNSTETYTWNEQKQRIDVDFQMRKGGFDGKVKKLPQKAWVDEPTHAQWKVQFVWPFKADYLIIALDPDYEWCAIGVSGKRYLWIMSSKPEMSQAQIDQVVSVLNAKSYPTHDLKRVPQKWSNSG